MLTDVVDVAKEERVRERGLARVLEHRDQRGWSAVAEKRGDGACAHPVVRVRREEVGRDRELVRARGRLIERPTRVQPPLSSTMSQ